MLPLIVALASVWSYPDEGSEPMGRGGAWVARATDPIAVARNPAGLVGQAMRLSVGEDIPFRHACFTRVKAANDGTNDGVAPGASYPRVCDDGKPVPVGYIALNVPLGPRAAIAAGIVTPHGVANASWPMFDGPQRYLLIDATTIMAIPTIGMAYEILPGLRVGASLGWGLAWVQTSAAAPGLAQDGIDPRDDDVKVTVRATDLFVPRATFGAHLTPSSYVEIGGSFMWSAPVDAGGDAMTEANAFRGDDSKIAHGHVDGASFTIPIPMEASLGVRLRFPRAADRVRDPLADEIGDIELDAAWSNDSAIDHYGVRFPSGFLVPGTAGTLPTSVDAERRFRDTVSVRLGGDWNVIPEKLALRAGTFVQPRAGEPGYTGLETMSGTRIGAAFGGTVRLQNEFELSFAYLHVFVSDLVATGDAIHTVTGVEPHRTRWPTALGTLEDGLDVIHVGVAYRF